MRHLSRQGSDWARLQAAYFRALGLCMIGENRQAVEAIEPFDGPVGSGSPNWILQSGAVMIADIFQATGELERASSVARHAFELCGWEPLGHGHTGIVARWIDRLGDRGDSTALDIIERLCDGLQCYDLLDQAEILCARERIGRRTGRNRTDCKVLLMDRLARLPNAVEEQLRRLGSMP